MKRSTTPMKRTPMKRTRMRYNAPAKDSRRDLERTLDDLTRKIVLAQETACFTCGQPGRPGDPLQNSHLFTRTWRPTRWDASPTGGNCHAQHKSENEAHEANPDAYNREFVKRYGVRAHDELFTRAHSHHKFTIIELHDMIAEREAVLARLQA